MAYLKIGNWEIHANGVRGSLLVQEIDELGRMSGTVFDRRVTGWWSERARRLSFVRETCEFNTAADQAYEGYAWDEPAGQGSRRYYIAGSYETFGGGGGAKDRQAFGWFATKSNC